MKSLSQQVVAVAYGLMRMPHHRSTEESGLIEGIGQLV